MNNETQMRIKSRLRPLYVAAFFQGLVFWYAIQILLARNIGVSVAGIGSIVAAMAVTTIVFEFPFGVLADRWSRRKVLLLSSLVIAISSVIGAVATRPWHYLLSQMVWGLFYAMYTGGYDAMVYDVLLEEGATDEYEYWFGRVGRYDSLALVISSLVGGLVAGIFGVRFAYALTLPAIALCFGAMYAFKEPTVHKRGETTQLLTHISETLHEVTKTKLLWFYLIAALAMGAACRVFFEFDQIWLTELGLPVVLFGLVNAGILASIGLRSVIVDRIKVERHMLLIVCLSVALIFAGLLTIPNATLAAVSLCCIALALMTAMLVMNSIQQKHFRSKLRSGANSLISTLTHVAFLPVSLAFGFIAGAWRVGIAVWLPFALIVVSLTFVIFSRREHGAIKPGQTSLQ